VKKAAAARICRSRETLTAQAPTGADRYIGLSCPETVQMSVKMAHHITVRGCSRMRSCMLTGSSRSSMVQKRGSLFCLLTSCFSFAVDPDQPPNGTIHIFTAIAQAVKRQWLRLQQ